MNSKLQLEQKDNSQYGFKVGELARYKSELIRIISFPTKWSAEVAFFKTVGAVEDKISETMIVSVLELR